jgi:hypothetical protein
MAARTAAFEGAGEAERRRAAMAAAWGAAAEVPQNEVNPGVVVVTQSAAVMSGFWSSRPPPEAKVTFPGVIALPFGL